MAKVVSARTVPLAVGPTEAARIIGVSRPTVYELAKAGKFPMLKLGGRTLIRTSDLSAYLDTLPKLYGVTASDNDPKT